MQAVGGVDLQALGVAAFGLVGHVFVHGGGAVARLGACVFGQVHLHGHIGVFQREVRGLVFLVAGVADENAREAVKGEFAVRLGVINGLALGCELELHVVKANSKLQCINVLD